MASAMELIAALEHTASSDQNVLLDANIYLEEAAASNLPELLKALSAVLADPTNSDLARMAAALFIKNHLYSWNDKVKQKKKEMWLQLPSEIREVIKYNLLAALGTENARPSCAAQCVAVLAANEQPAQRWNILFQTLPNYVTGEGSNELLRSSALEAIGYICQDMQCGMLQSEAKRLLVAIGHGMSEHEPCHRVRLAATMALHNSLECIKDVFETEGERIMLAVCNAVEIISKDAHTRVVALQCLAQLVSLRYQLLEPCIQEVFCVTLDAMKANDDAVALQGIEFWSTICQKEIDLDMESQESIEQSMQYARQAMPYLMPVLIKRLTEKNEFEAEDASNPATASSVCIKLMARCCKNDIEPHVLPFILANIESQNWELRHAAVMALASVLYELDINNVIPLVEPLIHLMSDPRVCVRDTTAWILGRICSVVPKRHLAALVECLLQNLHSEPSVASKVCWAFRGLSKAARRGDPTGETSALVRYINFIAEGLLETSDRSDGAQVNLNVAAYEALNSLILDSSEDGYLMVLHTTQAVYERIKKAIKMKPIIGSDCRQQLSDLLCQLCRTLKCLLSKLSVFDARLAADVIMEAMHSILRSSAGCLSGEVPGNVCHVVSALVDQLQLQFEKYLPDFMPILIRGLQTPQNYLTFCATIELTNNLCHVLKGQMAAYCDEVVPVLMNNLSAPSVHRAIKTPILSAIGVMACAIGGHFEKYAAQVLELLHNASDVQLDSTTDSSCELRESILAAYAGISYGLKGSVQLEPHLRHIISLIERLAQDGDMTESMAELATNLTRNLSSYTN
ncbi:importin subunit beta-like [Drosophila subobscura]|uniref:importin subunit beta-like n=1 Tax=Drosophila subobscura TaxID=7241 RepID=UPI00155B093A|nr:importin subunit beta-like [Drosophila subobscura]